MAKISTKQVLSGPSFSSESLLAWVDWIAKENLRKWKENSYEGDIIFFDHDKGVSRLRAICTKSSRNDSLDKNLERRERCGEESTIFPFGGLQQISSYLVVENPTYSKSAGTRAIEDCEGGTRPSP